MPFSLDLKTQVFLHQILELNPEIPKPSKNLCNFAHNMNEILLENPSETGDLKLLPAAGIGKSKKHAFSQIRHFTQL